MLNFVAVICDSIPQDNVAVFFLQNGEHHKRVCMLPPG